jgi:hypothetical protein
VTIDAETVWPSKERIEVRSGNALTLSALTFVTLDEKVRLSHE